MNPILCSGSIRGTSDATSKARYPSTRRCQEAISMRRRSMNWLRSRRRRWLEDILPSSPSSWQIRGSITHGNRVGKGIYRNWLRYICARKGTVPVLTRLERNGRQWRVLGRALPASVSVGRGGLKAGGARFPKLPMQAQLIDEVSKTWSHSSPGYGRTCSASRPSGCRTTSFSLVEIRFTRPGWWRRFAL